MLPPTTITTDAIALMAYLPCITSRQGSAAQVALAWSLQQGFTVIPLSTQRANLASNLVAQQLRLSDAELAYIATLVRGERQADPDFAPQWD